MPGEFRPDSVNNMPIEYFLTPDQLWSDAKDVIKSEISLQNFNTWFNSSSGVSLDDETFKISVPNKFTAEWLKNRFNQAIVKAVACCLGTSRKIEYVIGNSNDPISPVGNTPVKTTTGADSEPAATIKTDSVDFESNLNLRYLFDNFVVGDSNQFPHAAAKAVAEAPMQTKYNPLYIYGGSGLGKTHLVQAIGNEATANFSNLKVLYVTSEKFTNDFIDAIARKKTLEFARSYRSVDLLLLDDIQFFTGKEATQEQFFHTFNALYQAGKQIVLTSDRPPRDIKGLEERLLSRFQCGLVTDIQPPDLETRTAILNMIVKLQGLSIPPEVVAYIANNVTRNIRELEGSIIRLNAYGSLNGRKIDIQFAQEILKGTFTAGKEISIKSITENVADYYRINPDHLKSKRKTAELVRARQVAMYICRKYTTNSLKKIGEEFGGRDHSTVIHAISTVEDNLDSDFNLKSAVDSLEAAIKS
ncbi:MAG: chromosomal replication initiator protein DnaA [Candidatus Zixiibacteriota bacterium]|nr:MAG: chromosomal replication initiator protein DnaA [candidate division Zixibacteria bacterium]